MARTPRSLTARISTALTRVRRAVLRRRRPLAAALTAVAVAASLRSVAPPPPATRAVLVAARAVPAGSALTSEDLTTAHLPADAVPDGVVTAVDAAGRILAASVTRGEPITEPRLVGAGLAGAQPDATTLAVRLSDPDQAALLAAGDRIDLLATDPQHASTRTVAADVTVLAVPPRPPDTTGGALTGRLVVLAVPPADVDEVTSASVAAFVTYAWHNH